MNDAPKWILGFLSKGNVSCGLCEKKFCEDDLISLGIQESIVDANKDMLTIGLYCDDCNEVTLAEIKEMSLIEFSMNILEDDEEISDYTKINNKLDTKNDNKKKNKTNISKKDVSNVSKFLNSIDTHDELLTAMGMSPEDIEKIKKEGEREKKKDNYE